MGKEVRLEFDVALTNNSGEKIRSELENILKGIGSNGIEIKSITASAAAISGLRSQIESSLKDIPITFKASDIATSTGVIKGGSGTVIRSLQSELNSKLREYEKLWKNWSDARLKGKNNLAATNAQEAGKVAGEIRNMVAANKTLINQEQTLGKLSEIRNRITRQTVSSLKDQGKFQNKVTQEAAKKSADEKQQENIQKRLNEQLKSYESLKARALTADWKGQNNASSIARQAEEAESAYRKLAESITDVEARQSALAKIDESTAKIQADTNAANIANLEAKLAAYAKLEASAQKLEADESKPADAMSARMKADEAAAAYREQADAISDLEQKEAALNALEQTRMNVTEAVTQQTKIAADAERERALAKQQSQAVAMSDNVESQISGFNSLTAALIRSTVAYEEFVNARTQFAKGEIGFEEFSSKVQGIEQVMSGLVPVGKTVTGQLGNFFGRLSGRLKMAAFAAATRTIREMISAVKELDASLTQMQIVTGGTDSDIQQFSMNIAQTAKDIGSSITDLVDSATVFARLGYTEQESSVLSKYTSMLSNVGDIDVSTAQNAITSIVKAYGMGVDDIETVMDKMVAVGNNFPISVSQIAEGMTNAGSTLKVAGNDIEQSIALLTAANTSVQNINKASTGVRTIAARLRRSTAELDELGETITTAKYQQMVDMLTKHSVSLVDNNGELRDTYSIIQDIAAVWDTMSRNEQAALAEIAAGTRQQNIFTSLVLNFKEAQNAMGAMGHSAGELTTAYNTYMGSIQAHTGQLKAAFQELAQNMFESGMMNDFIDGARELVEALNPIASSIGNIVNAIGGMKGLLSIFAGGAIIKSATAIGGSVSEIINLLTTLAEKQSLGAGLTAFGEFLGFSGAGVGIGAGVAASIAAIGVALGGVLLVMNKLHQAEEQRKKDAEETAKNQKTRLSNYEKISNRYRELMSKESLDDSDMAELASLQSQIAAQQGRINTLVGEQGGQIDLVNGKYEEEAAKLDELIGKQAQLAQVSQEVDARNALNSTKNAYTPNLVETDSEDRKLLNVARAVDVLSMRIGREFSDKYAGGSLQDWLRSGTHSAEELRDVLGDIILDMQSTDDWRSQADKESMMIGYNQYQMLSNLLSLYDDYDKALESAKSKIIDTAESIATTAKFGENGILKGFEIVDEGSLKEAQNLLINTLLDSPEIREAWQRGIIESVDLAKIIDAALGSMSSEEFAQKVAKPVEGVMKKIERDVPPLFGENGLLAGDDKVPGIDKVIDNITKLYEWKDKIKKGDFTTKDMFDLLGDFPTLQEAANGIEDLSTDMYKLADAIQATIDASPNELIQRIDNYMSTNIVPDDVKAQLETWKKYLVDLTKAAEVAGETLPEKASKVMQAQEAIYTAAEDTSGLTMEHYKELIALNGDFADAVTVSGGKVVVDMEKAQKVVKNMAREYEKAISDQIKEDKKRLESLDALEKKQGSLSEAQQAERDSVQQNIQAMQALRGEIISTTAAYEEWIKAQNTPNAGSEIQHLKDTWDYIDRVTNPEYNKPKKKGEKGTPDVLFGQYNVDDFDKALKVWGKSVKDFMNGDTFDYEAVQKWAKGVKKYTKDGAVAVDNLVKDLKKAGLGKEKDGIFSLNEGVTVKDIAKKLGISPDAVKTLLEYSTTYGAFLEYIDEEADSASNSIDNLANKTDKLTERAKKMGKGGNVDLTKRPKVSKETMARYGWDLGEDDYATVQSVTWSNHDFMDEKMRSKVKPIAMNFTPIITDDKGNVVGVLTPDEMTAYAKDVLLGVREDDLGLKIGATFDGETWDDVVDKAGKAAQQIHEDQAKMYDDAKSSGDMQSTAAIDAMNNTLKESEAISTLLDAYDELRASEESLDKLKRAGPIPDSVMDSYEENARRAKESLEQAMSEPLNIDQVDTVRESIVNAIQALQKDKDARLSLGLDTSDIDGQISDLEQDLKDIEGTVKIKEDQESEAAVTSLQSLISELDEIKAKMSEVGGPFEVEMGYSQVTAAGAEADSTAAKLHAAEGPYDAYFTTHYKNNGTPPSGSGQGGGADAYGGVHGGAFAGGKALVGELGREIVVDPEKHKWFTVGERGAEFVNLPPHAIVFNHKQTKSLFSNGNVGSRGSSFAFGKAYDSNPKVGFKIDSNMVSTFASLLTGKPTKDKPKRYNYNSNKNTKKEKKNEETWFEKQYKKFNHLLEMDKKEQSEYLKWLDSAYKKAYKEKIISLDDYYKYQEEVYNGLKELFKDNIDDISSKIDELMHYDGSGKKVVEYYNSIISKVQNELKAAYKRGLDDNDDYVKELKAMYWEYADALKDYQDSINDDAKDSLDELVRYRMKMITKELNDEKDALQKRLKDMKDFYDEQKEMLHDAADEEDYLKEQTKKRKEVVDLEIQLQQLALDTSVKAQKKRLELEERLSEARDELYTFERDHAIELVEDQYDTIYEDAEKTTDKQIEEIDKLLEDQKYLYQRALDDIRNNSKALYNEMIAYNEHYVDGTGDAVVEMWERAYEAMYEYYKLYGKVFEGVKLGNYTGWAPTTYNTGTLKINGRKYATGTSSATRGMHQVEEYGPEAIFVTANGNRYRLFDGGEKVLNSKATQFLYDFANSRGSFISDVLQRSAEAIESLGHASSSIGSVAMGDIIIQGNATEKTVSEIRRAQRESVDYLLKEFRKLNK